MDVHVSFSFLFCAWRKHGLLFFSSMCDSSDDGKGGPPSACASFNNLRFLICATCCALYSAPGGLCLIRVGDGFWGVGGRGRSPLSLSLFPFLSLAVRCANALCLLETRRHHHTNTHTHIHLPTAPSAPLTPCSSSSSVHMRSGRATGEASPLTGTTWSPPCPPGWASSWPTTARPSGRTPRPSRPTPPSTSPSPTLGWAWCGCWW